jgi:hypothetical protein
VQLGSKRGDNIGLALSRGCIEMTWRESDEVTEIADELEERERSEEVNGSCSITACRGHYNKIL